MRRCRYRGQGKAHIQHVLTAIAVNIERLSGLPSAEEHLRPANRLLSRTTSTSARYPGRSPGELWAADLGISKIPDRVKLRGRGGGVRARVLVPAAVGADRGDHTTDILDGGAVQRGDVRRALDLPDPGRRVAAGVRRLRRGRGEEAQACGGQHEGAAGGQGAHAMEQGSGLEGYKGVRPPSW
ncbi:transposase [Streptomyces sp. TRM72054]|uniref:transposase n=1 Tax=Streptomyces sp. TRM72054 TaxID=2870562 RepID=UPI0021AB6FAD|nr:transposase [Streptomyces sp. TRM72054]